MFRAWSAAAAEKVWKSCYEANAKAMRLRHIATICEAKAQALKVFAAETWRSGPFPVLTAEAEAGEAAAERLGQIHCQLARGKAAALVEDSDDCTVAVNGDRQLAGFREKFGAIRLPAGDGGVHDWPPGMKCERKFNGCGRVAGLHQVEFRSGNEADQVIRAQSFFCNHGIDLLDLPFTLVG